jgi:hypothetical protein
VAAAASFIKYRNNMRNAQVFGKFSHEQRERSLKNGKKHKRSARGYLSRSNGGCLKKGGHLKREVVAQ